MITEDGDDLFVSHDVDRACTIRGRPKWGLGLHGALSTSRCEQSVGIVDVRPRCC